MGACVEARILGKPRTSRNRSVASIGGRQVAPSQTQALGAMVGGFAMADGGGSDSEGVKSTSVVGR